MRTIKVSKIVIPEKFIDSSPNKKKVMAIRQYIKQHRKLDKPIVLNGNTLVDGYIRYLVAVENEMDEIPFIKALNYKREHPNGKIPILYITGKFEHGRKEYLWKNDKGIPINVGDKVLVNSKNKITGKKRGVVIVTNIFESDKPSMLRHKSVVKKLDSVPMEQKK